MTNGVQIRIELDEKRTVSQQYLFSTINRLTTKSRQICI